MKLSVGGHEIELRDYLTGGQSLALREMQLNAAKMEVTVSELEAAAGDQSASEEIMRGKTVTLDNSIDIKVQKKALEFLVISFDGSTDKPHEKVLDLPVAECMEVLEVIDDLRGKKKSNRPTESQS